MSGPQQKGLFNKDAPPVQPMSIDVASLQTRVRLSEEKSSNLNSKLELLENNFVTSNKKRNDSIRELQADMLEMKHELEELKQKMVLIIRELKLTAGKDELNALTRYLDLWNPARFATREEVQKMIEEHLQQKHVEH